MTRRRRLCTSCGEKHSTLEVPYDPKDQNHVDMIHWIIDVLTGDDE